jgi:hypothetical protein
MFADTVDMVMGASLPAEKHHRLFGIATVLTLCALPLIKLARSSWSSNLPARSSSRWKDKKCQMPRRHGDNLMLVFAEFAVAPCVFSGYNDDHRRRSIHDAR